MKLNKTIKDPHGCESTWFQSVPVTETFHGQTVLDGAIQMSDVVGHPTASRSCAWSHAVARTYAPKFGHYRILMSVTVYFRLTYRLLTPPAPVSSASPSR